ncbi:MAG TPA: hypothetical protein VFG68_16425, partial [Fimbriiglobus sp.]|nr:hypothetical protein [Fimbriiglobus sp.]
MYVTFSDLLDHALAYLGGDAGRANSDRARRAVLAAYQDLPTRHPWKHYQTLGRVVTVASYATGTVAYTNSTRTVTLSGGTWPSWAASGTIVIADVPYDVETRDSNSALTLGTAQNPGADVAALTSYTLYQDTYAAPTDLLTGYELTLDAVGNRLAYRPPSEWAQLRRVNSTVGRPQLFCLTGGGTAAAGLVFRFWPAPDTIYPIDLLYKRRPRALAFDRKDAGTASATTSSTALTGANTAFAAAMAGSVVRLAADNKDAPTGNDGNNRAQFEGVISSVTSATALTLAAVADQTLAGVKYVISDPADIDQDVHLRLLYRLIERQCRIMARMKELPEEDREYQKALAEAREADSRYAGRQVAGLNEVRPLRLRDYPI